MARKPKLYQKLARMRGSVGTHFTLWLAADHVLQVEGNMVTERYQRVFLRDLQGFFMRPSREAKWATIIGGVLVAIFGGLAWALVSNLFRGRMNGEPMPDLAASQAWGAGAIFCAVLAGLCSLILLYGLFFARNCHFYAVTAVQRAEWTNIARRGKARKLIARLDPLIRAAQQDVSGAP